MSWAALALASLQLIIAVLEWTNRRGALAQAQQEVAVAQAARLLEMTERGRALRNRLAAMDDSEALKLWDEMIKR